MALAEIVLSVLSLRENLGDREGSSRRTMMTNMMTGDVIYSPTVRPIYPCIRYSAV